MTYDDAVAEIVRRTPLSATDISDLLDAAGDPGAIEMLMRVYARRGQSPDESTWQVFSEVLGQVAGVAEKVAPIVSLIVQIAPIL
jgi:hypothetical protein